ncbi:hypothetical protein HK104_006559 [Borealophlyctis nickersoniae]|nr:hypothetical protein HK104_006559 [Borealophlyctis nickersoniae]
MDAVVTSSLSPLPTATTTDAAPTATDTQDPGDGGGGWVCDETCMWQFMMVNNSQVIPQFISVGACLVTLASYVLIRRYCPQLANRISFRLAIGICWADLVYGLSGLTMAVPALPQSRELMPTLRSSKQWCATFMYTFLASELTSLFLTTCISVNLFLVFILKLRDTRRFEKFYFICSVLFALILPSIPAANDRLGWNFSECWFKPLDWEIAKVYEDYSFIPNERAVFIWEWMILYGWVALCISFCTSTTIFFWWMVQSEQRYVAMRVKSDADIDNNEKRSAAISEGSGISKSKFTKTDSVVTRAVARIAFYCIVPLVSQTFNIVIDAYTFENDAALQWWMPFCANVFGGSQGALNAIIFFAFDPGVAHARQALRSYLISTYYLPYAVPGYTPIRRISAPSSGPSSIIPAQSPQTPGLTSPKERAPLINQKSNVSEASGGGAKRSPSTSTMVVEPETSFRKLVYRAIEVMVLQKKDKKEIAVMVRRASDSSLVPPPVLSSPSSMPRPVSGLPRRTSALTLEDIVGSGDAVGRSVGGAAVTTPTSPTFSFLEPATGEAQAMETL